MIRHNIFSEDTKKAVASASAAFCSDPYLMRNYSWCRELLLKKKNPREAAEVVEMGIRYGEALGLDAHMLPVVYVDWMLPEAFEEEKKQGIPEQFFWESMRDAEIWVKVYRKYHENRTGLDHTEWVFRSLAGKVRRLGSLQFEEVTYEFPGLIFKNRRTGNYAALAAPSLKVDQDGYLSGTNGRQCIKETVTALDITESRATGFPIDLNQGIFRLERKASLDLLDWELKLAPGEKAVAVHIPEGADLSPDKIDSALETGKQFYEQDFFICASWLLDPHLELILSENSRILGFMNRFCKMPVKESAPQILERVMGFDFSMDKLEAFPCETSLQTALKKYLMKGNEVFTTAGFLPKI